MSLLFCVFNVNFVFILWDSGFAVDFVLLGPQ
jgi:hypothetical protein